MTGANYMGGKRNAAKARVRDSASRAQKRYFGAQRLNLAANRGSGMTEKSGVNLILDLAQTNGSTKSIPDIKLAHARQNSSNTTSQIVGYIPDPIRISPCTPKSQLRLSKISMDSNHTSSARIKPSRILQALDTCEPFALRAAMDEVLSLSDLAGLSRRPGRNLKRHHSSCSPCPREESSKQHKAALQFLTSSDSSTFTSTEVSDLGPSRRESSSDFEEAVVESQFAFNIPDDGVLGKDDKQGYSSDNNISATWTVYPNRKTDSPEMTRYIGPADRSSHRPLSRLSEPKHLNVTSSSPSYHVNSDNPMEYPHTSNSFSQTTPESNIFDYEDPWMAIGVMLGVEKTPLKPLKKRDFRKILAEIPTPVATPTSNVNIFATNDLVPDIIACSSSPSQLSDSKVRVSPSTYANTDAARNQFRIFSPSVQTQPIFPNTFRSLVPYSSDEAIFDPLSSPTDVNRLQPVLDFSIDPGRGIANQAQSDILTNIRPRSGSSEFSSPNYAREGKAGSYLAPEQELPLFPNLCNVLDVNTNDHRASNRAADLSSSPLFGHSLYSSSSHLRGQVLPRHRRQRHEPTHMHNHHHVPGGLSDFQGVAASQGGDPSSPLLTPIQFALSPRRSNFDSKYHVDFPFSAIAQAGDEHLHTPEQRTRIGTYKNRTPHDDTDAPTIRLVTTTKQSTAASPSIVNPDVSSPNDLQLHASQSDQLRDDRRFAPASMPRLNPRTKLSTELDTSLHRAPARYRSPAVCPTNATENLPRTPQTRISPLLSRFNASHAIPSSQSTLPTLFLKSPARRSARNYFHENTSKETDFQDTRQSTREDNQKTKIVFPTPARSIVRDSASKPEEEDVRERGLVESNVSKQPIPSAEVGSEKHSSREALRFSLFVDDEIVSDSESE
ncbi:hypothetical protein EV359DRAFT_78979 [Lentinula novae-zelandiae]|nr:hypothetical protein EV359DRAFT_78979 [Lentinula novae-zelandiae]